MEKTGNEKILKQAYTTEFKELAVCPQVLQSGRATIGKYVFAGLCVVEQRAGVTAGAVQRIAGLADDFPAVGDEFFCLCLGEVGSF